MEVVNGYVCNNCTDVEFAKKGVDPARPKDGPQGVHAIDKPQEARTERGSAVTFGGGIVPPEPSRTVTPAPYVPGSIVTVTA